MKGASLIIVTLPDEMQGKIYKNYIEPNLKAGQTLGFCHGFNIHFKYIVPPKGINVVMIAPKGPGHLVRSEFEKGGGVPCLVAVQKDATGNALKIALAWGNGIGGARAGIIETTFKEETETDLFGEQVRALRRLVGADQGGIRDAGRSRLSAGDRVLRMYARGEAHRRSDLPGRPELYAVFSISNTAEYGDLTRGPRIITDKTKKEMKKILERNHQRQVRQGMDRRKQDRAEEVQQAVQEGLQQPAGNGRPQAAQDDEVDRREGSLNGRFAIRN